MTRLIEFINDRVARYLTKSDVINATPAIVQSVENDNWATVQILCNDSVYMLRNLSGTNVSVGDACQVYYKKVLSQSNAYIGAAQPKGQSGSMQIVSFETVNNIGEHSGENYKIAEVSFVSNTVDNCYFSFSSSIKGTDNNDVIFYLYIDNEESGTTFIQSLTVDNSENVSFYLPIEIRNTGKHTLTVKGSGQCEVLYVTSHVYGFDLTEPERRLPDDYQEIEYLESSGTQYIELLGADMDGVYEDPTSSTLSGINYIECKACESDDYSIFGWYQTLNLTGSGDYYRMYGYGLSNQRYTSDVRIDLNVPHIFKLDVDKFYIDGVLKYTFSRAVSGVSRDVEIFRRGASPGYHDQGGHVRIYYIKWGRVINGKTILDVDAIPCIRKADGVAGMYDVVTQTFYTNQGSGEFITP